MNFKQFSALRILKGRLGFWLKKCLFSVTKASAPTHSVYAAIKASAALSSINSYFEPNSKGTTKSSSMCTMSVTKPINSLKYSGARFRLTSSTINRGMRIEHKEDVEISTSRSCLQDGFFERPKPKIYMFVSRTSNNFFFPDFLSRFTEGFYDLFFSHVRKWMFSFGYKLAQFGKMLLGLFNIWFSHIFTSFLITKFKHTSAFLSNNISDTVVLENARKISS